MLDRQEFSLSELLGSCSRQIARAPAKALEFECTIDHWPPTG
jgi:hypothetical protein